MKRVLSYKLFEAHDIKVKKGITRYTMVFLKVTLSYNGFVIGRLWIEGQDLHLKCILFFEFF